MLAKPAAGAASVAAVRGASSTAARRVPARLLLEELLLLGVAGATACRDRSRARLQMLLTAGCARG